MLVSITLDGWPPSLNAYWRSFRGRNILSKEAREYRRNVLDQLRAARMARKVPRNKITVPVSVDVELWPPDRRRRDLDNYQKGLFDALTKAGIWEDDSQVWDYRVHWGHGTVKGGKVCLQITLYEFFADSHSDGLLVQDPTSHMDFPKKSLSVAHRTKKRHSREQGKSQKTLWEE